MSLLRRIEQPNLPDGLKAQLETQLLAEFGTSIDAPSADIRSQVGDRFSTLLAEANIPLSRGEKTRLFSQLTSNILGLGFLDTLLGDETIHDIVINGPTLVFVRRQGKREWERSPMTFADLDVLEHIIRRLMPWKPVTWDQPLAHERHLNIGYITVTRVPATSTIWSLVIRKFELRGPMTAADFLQSGTLTPEALRYLQACVLARLNILIFGDEGAGKTRFLSLLCASVSDEELIVAVEEPEGLPFRHKLIISLVAHPKDVTEQLTMNTLILHALHMRPERLVIDELHLGQTTAIAQTDDIPWLTTVRARSVADVTPLLAPGADIVVHLRAFSDGKRKVENLFRVQGVRDGAFVFSDWQQSISPC